ncbi:MAG: ribonuclease III [Bacteroidales bacterium]|nr:ribonuclease III [Bacteroidales bacterium]MCR5550006.1 ribonuclease III [Bacteroidales bacterium]
MDKTDKEIRRYFKNIFGFRVRNVEPFRIALIHKSVSSNDAIGGRLNNERLEYLGDAILGSIIADFLYHKYPLESEGVLTRMRSKLVNRNRLNNLARKLGLPEMMRMDSHITSNTPNGNALEAVVGAIYIDQGFKRTYDIIIHNIFLTFLDMNEVYAEDDDYKSRILIWAQHNRHKVTFDIQNEDKGRDHLYRAILSIDGKECAQALGQSVKKAEQAAAEKALAAMETKE